MDGALAAGGMLAGNGAREQAAGGTGGESW